MANLNDTIQTLLNSRGMNRDVIQKGLETVDKNHVPNAPISCNCLESNKSKIIIKEELIEKLAYIKSTIDKQKGTGKIQELPFAMLGSKDRNGNVIITDIVYDAVQFENKLEEAMPGSLDTAVAEFDTELSTKMSNHLQRKDIEKPVVIHGHTHPQHLGVSANLTNNFSLDDMLAYQQYQENVSAVNPNAEVIGMVVNEIGDFNAVNYNQENNSFERMESVQIEDEPLPSFSAGNYLVASELEQNNEHVNQNLNANNAKTQIYADVLKQTNPTGETLIVEPKPKIERVTREEIAQTGYQFSEPYIPQHEDKLKEKGLFSKIKDFIGQVFSTDGLSKPKIIDESIKNSRSVVNTNFAKKLEALKMQDKMNGRNFE